MISLGLLFSLLIFSIIFAFTLAFPIIHLLYKFQITRRGDVDFSNLIDERSSKVGTPIMGGLIVVITVLIVNLLFNLDSTGLSAYCVLIVLLIFFISALIGGIDDVLNIYGKPRKVKRMRRVVKLIKVHKNPIKRLGYIVLFPWLLYKRVFHILGSHPGKGLFAHEKVTIQIFTGVIFALWFVLHPEVSQPFHLWFPLIGVFEIGWLIVPFIIFVIIAMTNAVNLSDGMDGLAAGLLFSSFSGFLIISLYQGNDSITLLIISVLGALIAYLYFNIPPARFQMGDVGSLSLGTLLAVVAFLLEVPMLLPVIGFPFVAEISSSLIQAIWRRLFGKRLLRMAPLHHHFEMLGWSEEKVVMRFWLAGATFAILGCWLYFIWV